MAFETVVTTMIEMTVFQVFFPWLLVLALSYGILDQYETISEDDSINAVIALAVSFMAVGGSYLFIPEGMLTQLAAGLTFGLFAVIGLLIVMGSAGFNLDELEDNKKSLPVIVGLSIFGLTLIAVTLGYTDVHASLWDTFLESIDDPYDFFDEIVMPILILAFMFGIVAFTLMGNGSEDE